MIRVNLPSSFAFFLSILVRPRERCRESSGHLKIANGDLAITPAFGCVCILAYPPRACRPIWRVNDRRGRCFACSNAICLLAIATHLFFSIRALVNPVPVLIQLLRSFCFICFWFWSTPGTSSIRCVRIQINFFFYLQLWGPVGHGKSIFVASGNVAPLFLLYQTPNPLCFPTKFVVF